MDLSNETSISTIWQPYQKLWALKCDFHTFVNPGIGFFYENGFRNHQIALRYKGIDQTCLMSYKYWQSGNPITSFKYLNFIFIPYLKPGVEFLWANSIGNHQKAPRHKGVNQTYLMSYWYQQSGNPIRRYQYLNCNFHTFFEAGCWISL